jgi:hypothetical protein
MITALAATELAYRLLLRARVRRALGMQPQRRPWRARGS